MKLFDKELPNQTQAPLQQQPVEKSFYIASKTNDGSGNNVKVDNDDVSTVEQNLFKNQAISIE